MTSSHSSAPTAHRRRAAILAIVVLIAAALAWWLMNRPEAPWQVSAHAAADRVTPWQSIQLTADITPKRDLAGWKVTWTNSFGKVVGEGAKVSWQSGALGENTVRVVARSPRGTERTAQVTITVANVASRGWNGSDIPADPTPDELVTPNVPFRITSVEVEKTRICQGEQSRIALHAEHDDGPAALGALQPVIAGGLAWETIFDAGPRKPGVYKLPIYLQEPDKGDMISTSVFIEVADCLPDILMSVKGDRDQYLDEVVLFTAQVRSSKVWADTGNPADAMPPPIAVDHYVWTFGDGTTETSTSPRISHSYPPLEEREHGHRMYGYPVEVVAMDAADKQIAETRMTMVLRNMYYSLKLSGRLELIAKVDQRPAATDDKGARYIDVTLRNVDDTETVHLTELKVRRMPCTLGDSPNLPMPVSTIFAESTVPPLSRISGRMTVSDLTPDVCAVIVDVIGVSEPGKMGAGTAFRMDIAAPTELELPVTDQRLLDAVKQASKILGRQADEGDLARLEHEGKIAEGTMQILNDMLAKANEERAKRGAPPPE